MSYRVCVSFSTFSVFSPLSRSYSVNFSFSTFFIISHNIPVPTMCISHFSRFSVFFFCHISSPTLCLSHFPRFSVSSPYYRSYSVCVSFFKLFSFLSIFQVLQYEFLDFHILQFFSPFSSPTLCTSYLTRFSVFLPYFRSYSVPFSFSTYLSFLAIFQIIQGLCLIFHVFQVYCYIPGPTGIISHISRFFQCFSSYFKSYSVCFIFSMIFSFLAIFKVLQCTFFIFHIFQYFSIYSRSNSVFVLFSTSFQNSCHIPDPTVCISHFPLFSVSLAIFHFVQCMFFIFHNF